MDLISRQAAIEAMSESLKRVFPEHRQIAEKCLKALPSAQPERLTDDDFETIRIHLNAYKEKLCNQGRWKEAVKYQNIIDRFMAFASAQTEPQWIPVSERLPEEEIDVLICNSTGNIEISRGSYSTEASDWIWYTSGWRFGKVIAWMPLPIAYREEKR